MKKGFLALFHGTKHTRFRGSKYYSSKKRIRSASAKRTKRSKAKSHSGNNEASDSARGKQHQYLCVAEKRIIIDSSSRVKFYRFPVS